MAKYSVDPVTRDTFTALDVSLLQIPFLVEGAQVDRRAAEIACIGAASVVLATATTVPFVSPTMAVAAVAGVAAVGWLVQLIRRLRAGGAAGGPATARAATWLATVVSVVHFVTAVNLAHDELAHDLFIRWGRRVLFVVHLSAGVVMTVTLLVMDRLNLAWGCYSKITGNADGTLAYTGRLSQLNYGPCGSAEPLPWEPNQAVCRHIATGSCSPQYSAAQMADRPLQYAVHVETAAFALYSAMCFHAFAIYSVRPGPKTTTKAVPSANFLL